MTLCKYDINKQRKTHGLTKIHFKFDTYFRHGQIKIIKKKNRCIDSIRVTVP